MAAEFPTNVKTWTPLVDGVDEILAAHHNEAYEEITAIEDYLLGSGGPVQCLEGWVTYAVTNPSLGTLPANALIARIVVTVVEAFNGGGADELDIGTDDNHERYVADLDVSETGENVLPGLGLVDASARAVEGYYSGGATAGKAHIRVEFIVATATP